ncbi:MAG TPA: histidine--tRNA ligase [Pyrinomonadaceae bacterium]|jgi:histidyl-tRNA synthetase|nr:histidine--tRNA ligase [Pyrinomonadaceae bacterium]
MPSAKTQPARGMRDFLPEDVRKREYVIGVIKEVYERYGFEPLETPAAENIETLMGKYGEEGNQLIYKILKRGVHEGTGEADLALRYDLTVPLARVVAEYRDKLPKFFKRYQIQPVWRADRPARGRYREFYQCDVDMLGSRSMIVEAEIISASTEALRKLGFTDFVVRLNHRKVLTGILDAAGIAPEKHGAALIALDKLDKIGTEGVLREFAEREVLTGDGGKDLLALFQTNTDNDQTLARLEQFIGGHVIGLEGLNDLREIIGYVSSSVVRIDPSLARGLSYYTGAIMEIQVQDLAGSLAGGGRYDNLVGMFLGQDIPACGFSLGLERIIVVMSERDMFPVNLLRSPAEVMVAVWRDGAAEALEIAAELRRQSVRTDVYPDRDTKLGTQISYAAKRGIPFVAFIGEDERGKGLLVLKNLKTGVQEILDRGEVAHVVMSEVRNV